MAVTINADGSVTHSGNNVEFTIGGGNDDTDIQTTFQDVVADLDNSGLYDYVSGQTASTDKINYTSDSPEVVSAITSQTDPINETPLTLLDTLNNSNTLKQNENYLKEESNRLQALQIKAIGDLTKITLATNLQISNKLDNLLNVHKELLKSNNLNTTVQDYQLIMQGQSFEQLLDLNTNIKELTKETKNQQLSATFGDVNLSMSGLTELNTKMTDTFEKVSQGIEVQKEHYDYLKNGSENLKDSKGQLIKPREVHALKSAEDSILSKDKNTFDSTKAIIEPLNKVLQDEQLLDSETSSGFGDFELKSILSGILNVDKSKFDFEYSSSLYSKDDTQGGV